MLANADNLQAPLREQSLEQLYKTLTYLIVAIALVTFLVGIFHSWARTTHEGSMVADCAPLQRSEEFTAIVTILLSPRTNDPC